MRSRSRVALLCALSLSSCSFMHGYVVKLEFDLTKCPPVGFEFPERVAAGKGMIVAGRQEWGYCHGFTAFQVYPIDPGIPYFDITDEKAGYTTVLARVERGAKCKLQIVARGRCEVNQHQEECRKTFPIVSASEFEDAIERGADGLLYQSGAKIERMAGMQVIGFTEDFEKWCDNRADRAPQVGRK